MAKKGKVATRAFMDRQISVRRLVAALEYLGTEITANELEIAYNVVEVKRQSKLNDPEFLRARLAELEKAAEQDEQAAA